MFYGNFLWCIGTSVVKRSGRPTEVATLETIEKIHNILLEFAFNRVKASKDSLMLFNRNQEEFWHRFIIEDENMDSPQHPGDQAAIKTVGFAM